MWFVLNTNRFCNHVFLCSFDLLGKSILWHLIIVWLRPSLHLQLLLRHVISILRHMPRLWDATWIGKLRSGHSPTSRVGMNTNANHINNMSCWLTQENMKTCGCDSHFLLYRGSWIVFQKLLVVYFLL